MTNNWLVSIENDTKAPETVSEAVDRLLLVLSDVQKAEIAAMKEDDLVNLHFGLGMQIRNAFGLHDQGSKLLADCGVVHPDDGAGVIIQELRNKVYKNCKYI